LVLENGKKPEKTDDVLYIYDDNQLEQLRNIPNIDIKNLLQMKIVFGGSSTENSDILFSNETEKDIENLLETVEEFIIHDISEPFNLDEI